MYLVQVEKDKLTAVEAIKNKEETELKCQQKIADMVALMEKHKVRSWFTSQLVLLQPPPQTHHMSMYSFNDLFIGPL